YFLLWWDSGAVTITKSSGIKRVALESRVRRYGLEKMRTLLAALALLTSFARGQLPTLLHIFEVASVKPSDGKDHARIMLQRSSLRVTNSTLQNCITIAFKVENYQLIGAPAWLNSATYDIYAKPPTGLSATDSQLADMFQ